jgi:hypothetical protein
VDHIVYWPSGGRPSGPLPALCAHFGHCFFSALTSSAASIQEAFAVAAHALQAYFPAGSGMLRQLPAALPALLAAYPPRLPGDMVPEPPLLSGLDPRLPAQELQEGARPPARACCLARACCRLAARPSRADLVW